MKKNISKSLSLIMVCVTLLFGTPTHAFNPQPEPPANQKKSRTMNQVKRYDSINYGGPDTQYRSIKIRTDRTAQMQNLKHTHPASKNTGSKATNLKLNSINNHYPTIPN